MSNSITIHSHRGPYHVSFSDAPVAQIVAEADSGSTHVIIDRAIAELYATPLQAILAKPSTLVIEATEENKSLDKFPAYIEHIVSNGVRRNHTLLGIGGGIVQDIVCFVAATLLRGISWDFIPTTLLAQTDSCIGSKSSINVGKTKNILGTFTPPKDITIASAFLDTLQKREIHSGIGEMLKVHVIDGPTSFDKIALHFDELFENRSTLNHYIRESLLIKKGIIELDEFDTGIRNVMNYGHSFGHAIETATDFKVPHGIAVTIGMDAENFISAGLDLGNREDFERMHPILQKNAPREFRHPVAIDQLFNALSRDKKNTDSKLSLILTDKECRVARIGVDFDERFKKLCEEYFTTFY